MSKMKRKHYTILSMVLTICLFVGIVVSPISTQAQGGVTGFANLRITNFYRAAPRPVQTVVNDYVINPTGTYTRLSSAGAVGTSGGTITVEPAGTLLILVNVGANTITITETGTLKSAGNIALGTLDSATLLSDGTNWYQIGASNN